MGRISGIGLFTIAILASSLLVLDAPNASAQQSRPWLTTSVGIIRNVRTDNFGRRFSIYPEIQINEILFGAKNEGFSIDGNLYVGGWADLGEMFHLRICGTLPPCIDRRISQSYSSLIVGYRVTLITNVGRAVLSSFLGLSRQFIWFRQKKTDYPFDKLREVTGINAVEVGVRVQVPVREKILLGFGVQRYWNIFDSRYNVDRRYAYTLGIGYITSGRGVSRAPYKDARRRRPLITTSLGIIRNLQGDDDQPHYAVYPEIQYNLKLVEDLLGAFALDAAAYIGGWSESISAHVVKRNCWSGFSGTSGCDRDIHSSLLLGARLNFALTKAPAFLVYSVGLSRHLIRTVEERSDLRGKIIRKKTYGSSLWAIEGGLRLQLPVRSNLLFGAGVQAYMKLAAPRHEINPRMAYSLGLSYVRR